MPTVLNSHPTPFYRRWGQSKYTPGPCVTSLDAFLIGARDGRWFYIGHETPKHASIYLNQSVGRVARLIEKQILRVANRSPEFPYVFKADWHKSRAKPEVRSQWWATCSELPGQQIVAYTRRELLKRCIEAVTTHTGLTAVRVEVQLNTGR